MAKPPQRLRPEPDREPKTQYAALPWRPSPEGPRAAMRAPLTSTNFRASGLSGRRIGPMCKPADRAPLTAIDEFERRDVGRITFQREARASDSFRASVT